MNESALTDDQKNELIRTARTTLGDELRSVVYFTPDEVEQLYLRDDLDRDADIVGFAEDERLGFRAQRSYEGTELGGYDFTIRSFERGYLTRVIDGDRGVWVTTDEMSIDRFEELASGLAGVLAEL